MKPPGCLLEKSANGPGASLAKWAMIIDGPSRANLDPLIFTPFGEHVLLIVNPLKKLCLPYVSGHRHNPLRTVTLNELDDCKIASALQYTITVLRGERTNTTIERPFFAPCAVVLHKTTLGHSPHAQTSAAAVIHFLLPH